MSYDCIENPNTCEWARKIGGRWNCTADSGECRFTPEYKGFFEKLDTAQDRRLEEQEGAAR